MSVALRVISYVLPTPGFAAIWTLGRDRGVDARRDHYDAPGHYACQGRLAGQRNLSPHPAFGADQRNPREVKILPARVVDALPLSLWRPDDPPFHLGYRLHFCCDEVRTIEWKGTEISRGRVPFPHSECERRWPHGHGDQRGQVLGGDAGVACAYCGEAVSYTDRDPIGVGVVERWKPYDEDIDWMV